MPQDQEAPKGRSPVCGTGLPQKGIDMNQLLKALSSALLFTVSAFANPWTGRLLDATCYSAHKESPSTECNVTETTTSFGILVDGKFYKLDASGNTEAARLVKTQAGDPVTGEKPNVMAKVTGELDGDKINVKTIEVQK